MIRDKRQKVSLLIPLGIITGLLIYSWITFLLTDVTITWQHYLAIGLFAVLVVLYFRSFEQTVIATGLYLLLATFNILSMTPQIITSWFKIGSIETPHFGTLSSLLLLLFLILNSDALVNMYLDQKEAKTKRRS
ncbi:MAG: hypothetical protein ACTHNG_03315 [Ginsengibacter sp.]